MGEVSTIGLDIAKSVFQVHGVDDAGAVVIRRRIRRSKVLEFFAAVAIGLNMIKSRQALRPGGDQWTNTILVAVFMLLLAIGWYFDRGPR